MAKDPWDWTEADLQRLVDDQVMESLTLEYKACASLTNDDKAKEELSTDVSAFANATGGTIIYGVQEGKKDRKHLPVQLDIGYDPQILSREWLENVIQSTVHPRIEGLRIHPVPLATGRISYVVWIPQSDRGHMAADKRYYKRQNFRRVPMEDYEVRDVMHRASGPDLELVVHIQGVTIGPDVVIPVSSHRNPNDPSQRVGTMTIGATVVNHADTPAEYAVFRLFFGDGIEILALPSGFKQSDDATSCVVHTAINAIQVPGQTITLNYGIPAKMPLWSGISWGIVDHARIRLPLNQPCVFISEVRSPRMISRSTVSTLLYNGTTVSVLPMQPAHLVSSNNP